jgi:signal transduction histidine kinase
MSSNLTETDPLKRKVILILWPVAAIFFSVYIPVSFFILKNFIEGWILSATFLFFIISIIIYFKTRNARIVSHMFAMLGFPVLMPWLIDGGPSGAGFWWSLVNVVWVYFVTNKRSAIFWSSAHLFVTLVIVILSQMGFFTIAYPLPELLNFLFAFITIFILVYLFDMAREYYLLLYIKRTEELAVLNKDLISANHELEQFAYAASHDLQEPLRTISNFTKELQKKNSEKKDEESELYIKYIVSSSAKMQNLIKDLLDFSRVGKNISFTMVDCNEILKEVIMEIDAAIKEAKAEIVFEKLPVLTGNATELKRLFQNLISNAIKFQKKGTTPVIKITVEETESEYVFAVEDNGIGIDEKYIGKLFVVFQRLNNASEYPGTGIGLAICKKIVMLHGGEIWVKSKPGEGSTFYFSITKEIIPKV